MAPSTSLICGGCGASPAAGDPYPFRCPNAARDPQVDHILARVLSPGAIPSADARSVLLSDEPDPFHRYRRFFHSWHTAMSGGITDEDYCDIVRDLSRAVRDVDARTFAITPFEPAPRLGEALGVDATTTIRVKNETGNVSGSHKARHLMGIMIWLKVVERIGLADVGRHLRVRKGKETDTPASPARRLAIASCGNAALAAAVVARAAGRALDVYVPPDAHPAVVTRLKSLGATLIVCRREGENRGDPCYLKFLDAVSAGSIPFTCQGSANGLTLEGGQTLGYEMISEMLAGGFSLDRIFIQVGGGALASSIIRAFEEAVSLGIIAGLPKFQLVQTQGTFPLGRAYERVSDRILARLRRKDARSGDASRFDRLLEPAASGIITEELQYAANHRSEFMWPWEETPKSIATGILDDETYDWLSDVHGMLLSGGYPLGVSEETLAEANRIARETTGIPVDPTGSAGLAGLLDLSRRGLISDGESIAVLFTGVDRSI